MIRSIPAYLLAAALGAMALPQPAFAADAPSPAPHSPVAFVVRADGTLVHVASGAAFPAAIAGFKRSREQTYDMRGRYVMVQYKDPVPGGTITARISLVHVLGMSAKDHYLIMKPLARDYFHDIQPKSEGPYRVAGQPQADAYRGSFTGTRDGHPWIFNLTTVDLGYWGARIATAYPASVQKEADGEIAKLITALRSSSKLHAPVRNRHPRRS